MDSALAFGILAFTSLLAIVNPLGAVPIYLAMTGSYTRLQRRYTLRRAIVTAGAVMMIFALVGQGILDFFGITTPAFQIAGGIIFFGIGWDMLQARRSRVKTTEEEEVEGSERGDVGIIPLGLPTLAGPGAITTVVALSGQTSRLAQVIGVYVAIVGVLAVSWVVLSVAPLMLRTFGQTGLNVMTRVMGLLVTVIGVQLVINGSSTVLRGLLAGS